MIFIGACFVFKAVALSACFFVIFRNNWVYKNRIKIIYERYYEYDSYHDYDYMVKRFWIWDIEKFRIKS